MNLTQKIVLAVIFSSLFLYSQDAGKLQQRIDSFLFLKEFLEKSIIAIEVYDLTSSSSLYSLNSQKLLRPASNMKLLTSAAGILFLPDYCFRTSLLYTGQIVNGKLLGDLFIKGGCDPCFLISELDSLINHLKASGIYEISGNIYADLSFKDNKYWGKGWMWDDEPSSDAPYLSALNINFNSVKLSAVPNDSSEHPLITIDPQSSYFTIDNSALNVEGTGEPETLSITREWMKHSNNITVSGTIDKGDTSSRNQILSVYDPAAYFLILFKERLQSYQIVFNGSLSIMNAPSFAENLYTYKRLLDSVIYPVNKISDNLSAEMILYALAEKYYGQPAAAENGILMIDSLISLTGLKPGDYNIADGSGVSHYNLVSTELIVALLKYFYYQRPELYAKLYNSLPIAGIDGTLRNRMTGTKAEGKVHAKTGTLTGVSCISGYADTLSGRKLAFSIMIQNYAGDSQYARYIQDEICRILTEY